MGASPESLDIDQAGANAAGPGIELGRVREIEIVGQASPQSETIWTRETRCSDHFLETETGEVENTCGRQKAGTSRLLPAEAGETSAALPAAAGGAPSARKKRLGDGARPLAGFAAASWDVAGRHVHRLARNSPP